jgi:GMP synthase (glutamine-hydrolysing)
MVGDGIGSLESVLHEKAIKFEYIDSFYEDFSGFDELSPELLVVTGGSMGVYQLEDYPFLKKEILMIENRLKHNLPVFGICLGAQMIAKALGSNVYEGKNGIEKGWFPIEVLDEGKDTPVQHLDKKNTSMLHWHGDTFDLPSGATRLASSEKYENQAFSWGNNVMGLQCHLEITQKLLMSWLVSSAASVKKGELDIENVRKETEKHIGVLNIQSFKFFSEWIEGLQINA